MEVFEIRILIGRLGHPPPPSNLWCDAGADDYSIRMQGSSIEIFALHFMMTLAASFCCNSTALKGFKDCLSFQQTWLLDDGRLLDGHA